MDSPCKILGCRHGHALFVDIPALQDARDISPGMSTGLQPARTSSTGTAQPVQRHPFNPLTAIHGEFIPGALAWRADRRSRRIRAIERNRLRAEEAEREAERVRTTA